MTKINPSKKALLIPRFLIFQLLSVLATLENGPISMVLSGQSSAPAPAPTLSNNNNSVTSLSSEF
jgi:hypothetical protein